MLRALRVWNIRSSYHHETHADTIKNMHTRKHELILIKKKNKKKLKILNFYTPLSLYLLVQIHNCQVIVITYNQLISSIKRNEKNNYKFSFSAYTHNHKTMFFKILIKTNN